MPNSVVEEIFLRSAPAGFVGAHRIKSKPYALIEYEDAASAAAARRELHGTHSDLIKKWIFLFFAKWLPAPFDVAAAFDSTSSGRIPSTPDTDVAPEPCATGPLPKGLCTLRTALLPAKSYLNVIYDPSHCTKFYFCR